MGSIWTIGEDGVDMERQAVANDLCLALVLKSRGPGVTVSQL